eukprot:TRINITY_DN3768_c0_g1_i1.p2 TRINITY_DN3768_c0_g1~~TRINITY_DN3768_c0_g1_i1.p2  ORF type:complete len:52 (+),score=6.01 TRINITY_DN3768_c0_g1_i1:741-896(+)
MVFTAILSKLETSRLLLVGVLDLAMAGVSGSRNSERNYGIRSMYGCIWPLV